MKSPRIFFAAATFALTFPFFLPRRMRVFRKTVIHASPAEIFPFINDLRNWPLWTEWSRRDEMHVSYEGPPAGVGATQHWEMEKKRGTLTISHSSPDARIAYSIEMGGGCRLEGVIALDAAGPLTTVMWTCKWDNGENPYARYSGLFLKNCIKRDFAASLANLRALIESQRRA